MDRTVVRQTGVVLLGSLLAVQLVVGSLGLGLGVGMAAGQAANGTNGTNTSTTTPDGQLGRLSGTSQTNGSNGSGTGQQVVVDFARSLQQTNKSNAQRLVRENPSKSAQIIERVGSEYPGNTTQQLHETPKQVAGLYLGLVGSGRPNRGDNGPSGRSTGGDGGGGGGLFGFSMREDVIAPTLNTTKEGLQEGMMWALNKSMEVTVGTPVPEDDDDNGIVFVPTNDGWSNMYHEYFLPYIFPLALALALASMIAKCGLMPWRALRNPTYNQSQAFVGFVLTLFAIVFTVPIITVMHTTIDILATNVAPSPKELTQSTKGLMNLGSGAIFAILGAAVIGFTEALGLAFIYALRYGALFVVPWFLPLLVALAYNAPHKRLSGFASEMIWQYIGLLIQAFPVALLLRAAYVLQWDFGFGGFIGMLASGAIFLAAIGLPILTSIGMFKAAPSVQSVASGAAGYMVGSQASNYARQAPGQAARGGYSMMSSARDTAGTKFSQVKEAIREYRESGGESDPSRDGIPDSGQL